MQCPVCNGQNFIVGTPEIKDYEYESPGAHTYSICQTCGLLRITPFPDPETLSKAYPPHYHAYSPPPNALSMFMKRAYWRDKARRYAKYLPPNAAVLDLGCANGTFLAELRALGIKNLEGLDSSSQAAEAMQAQGLTCHLGDLEDVQLTPGSYDLITMTNYIEHVFDPKSCLKKCSELLRPGGWLIGETPNTDCWDRHLFGKYWGGYHTPRHIYLFNRRNLFMLGMASGFAHASVTNILQPAHWALSIQNMLQDSALKKESMNGRIFLYSLIQIVFLPINILQNFVSGGTSVEFVFRKDQ